MDEVYCQFHIEFVPGLGFSTLQAVKLKRVMDENSRPTNLEGDVETEAL